MVMKNASAPTHASRRLAFRHVSVLVVSLLTLSVLGHSALAQTAAPSGRDVAAAVQAFYDQTRGVRAKFKQTYFHKLYDRYDRSSGQVIFVKPGKMRWDYDRPNNKRIVSDGQKLYVFEPAEDGAPPQLFERALSEDQLPQAFSFLTGTGRLDEDFRFRLLDATRQGFSDGYVLELRPKAPTPHYERILFYVLKRDGRPAGVVQRVLIIDEAGNRNRFDLSGFEWNPNVSDSTFRFTPPRGTRRVRP